MPLTLTDTIQLKKELKPAIKPFSVMECVHSVLTDNATFGASYEKGAVRILTAFRLHCFRALASVVSLPRSVWKLAPRPMRGFFTRPDLQQQQTRKTPAKGDLAGEVWDTSGRDCLWSDSDQPSKTTYIAPRGHPPASQVSHLWRNRAAR